MTTKEILIAARKLIEQREHWTQGTFYSVGGDRMCAIGAIFRASQQAESFSMCPEIALERVCGGAVGPFNDTHTHAEVLAAFDRAIEAQP